MTVWEKVCRGLLAMALVAGGPGPAGASAVWPSPPPSASVYLTTLPEGADVWIDGIYVGRSPLFVAALLPGRHAITATRTGWQSQEVDVTLTGGETDVQSVALQRLPGRRPISTGRLVLVGVKELQGLSVDGSMVSLGSDLATTVGAGTHLVVVHLPGRTVVRQVTIFPDTTTELLVAPGAPPIPVVARASDFLPPSSYQFGTAGIYITYHGHQVSAHVGNPRVRLDGTLVILNAAPAFIDGKLYLPLDLLQRLGVHERGE